MQWDMDGSEKKKRIQYWRKLLLVGTFTEQLCLFVCHMFVTFHI